MKKTGEGKNAPKIINPTTLLIKNPYNYKWLQLVGYANCTIRVVDSLVAAHVASKGFLAYLHNMKPYLLLICFTILLAFKASTQAHIRLENAKNYVGKTIEVVGHAYFQRSVNKDFVILKLAYTRHSPSLPMYSEFKNASTFANLTNFEFGHFRGVVSLVKTTPILIIAELDDAWFNIPNDERVDSGLYYLNKGKVKRQVKPNSKQ